MIIDLQMFAEAVQGKKLVYLFRLLKNAATKSGVTLAFTTENERTKSKDSDATETKDGPIQTPGATEQEINFTSILAVGDEMVGELEDALDNGDIVEIWEANLAEPVEGGENKFKGRYFQGLVTEISLTSSAEEYVEASGTFAINGTGAKGEVTVSAEQQEIANYVFKDTQSTGA